MNRVFSRPLFRGNFIQRFAQGGIVSTVATPQDQDPMAILQGMAEQVDITEQNLEESNNIDEIISSFTGTPKTADDARMELAEYVGEDDAMQTPDSVLALVQPAMAIMEMSRQMGPQSGIGSVPMDPNAAPMEGAAPTNFTQSPDGAMVPGFAVGGDVDYNRIMQDYAGMQSAIPRQYGSDPASAWLALAQLGAGMAQGKTFAQGLSMGTQMAAPVMQQGIQNVRDERSRLSAFVAAEATRQREAAARAAELSDTRSYEEGQADTAFERQKELARLQADLREPPERLQLINEYTNLQTQYDELPEDDPTRPQLRTRIDALRAAIFPASADTSTSDMKNAARLAELEKLIAADPTNITLIAERDYLKAITAKSESASGTDVMQNAARLAELETSIAADPTNQKLIAERDAIKMQLEKDKKPTSLQAKNVVIFDPTAPNGFRTAVANYDNEQGLFFTKKPDGTTEYLDPSNVVEGTADSVVTVTPNNIGGTVVTIKQGPRAGESYTSSFTKSDGTKVELSSPVGIGVEPGTPYSVERPAPTVPPEMLNPQTRDDFATKLSGIEQAIRSVDMLLKDTLKTGPLATIQGWSTSAAALTPDQISEMMEFLKTEQGAAQWALVQREVVRARVLSPRFAVAEQEAVRQFETQAGPQEFFTNPKAAAVRLGEILRTMKNEYEYLKGTLSGSPYRELEPQTLGTSDDPFDMSDEQDNAYVNLMLKDPQTRAGLAESTMFFPNFPAQLAPLAQKFQKTNGPKGVGYYIRFGDMQ